MNILYDYQAFVWSKYAGIPRYFSELINQFKCDPEVNPVLPNFYTVSDDYRNTGFREHHSLDKVRDFVIRDGIVQTTLKLWNRNSAKLLCTRTAEKASVELLKSGNFDVFHPTHHLTYFKDYVGKKPYVMTIHDLSVEIYPEYVSLATKLRKNTEDLLKNVTQIITVSNSTKNDLIEYYDVNPEIVTTVYLAPTFDRKWVGEVLRNDIYPVHQRPYLLFVNMRSGRKNFYTLINAVRKILIERDLDLLCVGGGPFTRDEKQFLLSAGVINRVFQITPGNAELYSIYKHALAFLYPSVNEGFGIPILEAFACGCPVVLSNASCLPEIGGDGAVYFDPKGIKSIRESVYRVLDDEILRRQIRNRGYHQLDKFNWKKCADETKTVYRKAMEFVI